MYGYLGCARYVRDVAKTAGLPAPSIDSAGALESDLPKSGWSPVPHDQAQPGDILATPGSGPSGRHVEIYQGNDRAIGDAGSSSGYRASYGSVRMNDPSSRFYRAPVQAGQANPSFAPANAIVPTQPDQSSNEQTYLRNQNWARALHTTDLINTAADLVGNDPQQPRVPWPVKPKPMQPSQNAFGDPVQLQRQLHRTLGEARQQSAMKLPDMVPNGNIYAPPPGAAERAAAFQAWVQGKKLTPAQQSLLTPVHGTEPDTPQLSGSAWWDKTLRNLSDQIGGSPVGKFMADLASTPKLGEDMPLPKGYPVTAAQAARLEQDAQDTDAAVRSIGPGAVALGRGFAQPFIPLAHKVALDNIENDPYYDTHPQARKDIINALKTQIRFDPKASDSILSALPFGSNASTKMKLGALTNLLMNDPRGIDQMNTANAKFAAEAQADPAGTALNYGSLTLPFVLHGIGAIGERAASILGTSDIAEEDRPVAVGKNIAQPRDPQTAIDHALQSSFGQKSVSFRSAIHPDIWKSVSGKFVSGESLSRAEQNALNNAFATTFKGAKPGPEGKYPLLENAISKARASGELYQSDAAHAPANATEATHTQAGHDGQKFPTGAADVTVDSSKNRGTIRPGTAPDVPRPQASLHAGGDFSKAVLGKISEDELLDLKSQLEHDSDNKYRVYFNSAYAQERRSDCFTKGPYRPGVHFLNGSDADYDKGLVLEEFEHAYDALYPKTNTVPWEENELHHAQTALNLIDNDRLYTTKADNERLRTLAAELTKIGMAKRRGEQ